MSLKTIFMILQNEFYFSVRNRIKGNASKDAIDLQDNSESIKVTTFNLVKQIDFSSILIREWVKEKAVEIIINPNVSKLSERNRTINAVSVALGSSPKDGGKLGIVETTIGLPKDKSSEKEDEISVKDLLNGLFEINGYGRKGWVNKPGGEALEDGNNSKKTIADAAAVLSVALVRGALEFLKWAKENPEKVAAGLAASEGAAAAATAAGATLLDSIAIGLLLLIYTPQVDNLNEGKKVTVPLGAKPTAIPVVKHGKITVPEPATDDILGGKDEPLFVFKQFNQAKDPLNPDQKEPELGGDIIIVFNTGRGVTDPQVDKSRVIGSFIR
jgi:hypothetical protein